MALEINGTVTRSEFLACQVESNTPILSSRHEALATVRAYRRELAIAARDHGMQVMASGTPPIISQSPAVITQTERYRELHALYQGITNEQYLAGLHIHVQIEDLASGVVALNGLRSWLPLLTACSSNSPYWQGEDTGFASWRNIHYRRFALHGIPPYFADVQDYERRMKFILDSEVVLDAANITWGARLSARYPTVEVRVTDTQLFGSVSVLLAVVVRSLIDSCLERGAACPPPPPEALDLAQWQASKFGLRGNHLDTSRIAKVSAAKMLRNLVSFIQPALKRNGDFDFVADGLTKLLLHGTGAAVQRSLHARGGFPVLLEESNLGIAS